ncbi:MAG: argininosuccinate lyase [Fimbriimonadaceae bacterium]
MRKLWGGAFTDGPDEIVARFGQSMETDITFWQEDLIGSVAHARMLGATGIIPQEEAELIVKGLEQIHEEGPDKLPTDVEDIHTAIELRLQELIGDTAGKLHTARSRNDQVATDTRLFLHNQLLVVFDLIKDLQKTILEQAETHKAALMPGTTHQQHAQPITLGFHLLAHFWALQRHGWRAEKLFELANLCPLGSAALAGTGFPIDRHMAAAALGFSAPIPNALDAVSDRSFVLDALHLCCGIMIDLSRIGQELVLWSTREFGWVKLSDKVTTGSSIMPQKRNPDMAELIRGRTGRAIGNYTALAATLKSLPLGYNRDTQDDKPPLFDSLALIEDSLRLTRLMLESAQWQTDRMADSLKGDFSTATDLADHLASTPVILRDEGPLPAGSISQEKGPMTFRQAHEVVGNIVRYCEGKGIGLEDLTAAELAELTAIQQSSNEAIQQPNTSPLESVRRRNSFGAPGPEAMRVQIDRARELREEPHFQTLA